MNKLYRARARPLLVAALAAAGAASSVSAQSVFFSGYTQGCFGVSCTPTSSNTTLGGLTFLPNTGGFAGTTAGGFLALGDATAGSNQNFGHFTLSNAAFNYTGQSFTLLIQFVDPAASNNLFAASLLGRVIHNPVSGGVFIDFDNNPQYWYSGGNTYSVALSDNNIIAPVTGTSIIVAQGHVTATTVPEPASLFLFGTGLLGLGALRRRKKKVV